MRPVFPVVATNQSLHTLLQDLKANQPDKRLFLASEVYTTFKKMSDADLHLLSLSDEYARPEWMILTVLPVPPPPVRPSIAVRWRHHAQRGRSRGARVVAEEEQRSYRQRRRPFTFWIRPRSSTSGPRVAGMRAGDGWDLVVDKGTYDAIALSEKADEEGIRVYRRYPLRVAEIVKPGGYFLITCESFMLILLLTLK